MALLANLWARPLPCLLTCWKKIQLKKEQRNLMSCRICPNLDCAIILPLMELIMIFESPSTITLWKPNSLANQRARRAASTSTISTEVGSGICCDRAAIANPFLLQIIIPKPAIFSSAESVLSKLILSRPDGGGRHLTDLAVLGIFSCVGRSWYTPGELLAPRS